VGVFVTYKGWHHVHYVYALRNLVFITRLTGPKIVDTQFQDGAGSILLPFSRIKVVNAVVMYNHYNITS